MRITYGREEDIRRASEAKDREICRLEQEKLQRKETRKTLFWTLVCFAFIATVYILISIDEGSWWWFVDEFFNG